MEGEIQVTESTPVTSSDAPAPNQEVTQSNETTSHETSQSATAVDSKPAGFDPVDVSTATPEQIKARIDRLYANVKRGEGETRELREQNRQLMQSLEQLYQGQNQIVSHLQTTDYQEAEGRLQGDRDNAWKAGDLAGYHKANDALVEIRAQKAFDQKMAKQQPQKQTSVQQPISGERLVNTAIQRGEIDPAETNIARSWMGETDSSGNIKRSWTQEGDPRNYEAALIGKAVFESPLYSNKSMVEKLKEIDRRMGMPVQQQSGGQNVLGTGNLTRGNQRSNIKLTDVERTIAIRTKFAGSKAKSDEDHAAAYLQAKIKSQPKGASR